MANLKGLLKDTAIYGVSSIVARFINFILVPIQTKRFNAAGGQYGIITNVYAYVALFIILLTYGMETTFFRFMSKEGERPERIYSTTLRMVGTTSLIFAVIISIFIHPLASLMGYQDHPEYIWVMFVTVAIDAFVAIPMAYLRYLHKPIKFASIQVFNILMNIILNVAYLIVLPALKLNPFGIYDDQFTLEVVWVFYINIFCSTLKMLLLWKELEGIRFGFDKAACKRMLGYAWPLLIMGLAGQFNQSASQILFPYFYDGSIEEAHAQLGIYGGCIKVAMIMVMITQAFRYAYEPFVFGKSKDKDSKDTYAQAMKYFIIFTLLAFLFVIAYMNILRLLIGKSYWEGLRVVPITMAAEIMFGIFFSLSFWYKLIDKTIWGAYFSGIGALVLVIIDVLFIPRFSYMACAWAGFAGYGTSMLLSYFIGQKNFPVNYPLRDIFFYVGLTMVFFVGMNLANNTLPVWASIGFNTIILVFFVAVIVKRDLPLASLPFIGRYFKK